MAGAATFSAAGFLVVAPGASAAATSTLYVDNVAGAATTGCASSGAGACQTIQEGVSAAEALSDTSVTLEVAGSATVYDEAVTVAVPAGDTLDIDGSGAVAPTIDDGGTASDVTITAGTVTLNGLVMSGGTSGNPGGGGVQNDGGTLTLTNDTLTDDSVTNSVYEIGGGGLYNGGKAVVTDDTFRGDSALQGGAIGNNGTLTMDDDTVDHDTATLIGGIFQYSGSADLTNTTLTDDTASVDGIGAIDDQEGSVVLDDDTLANDNSDGIAINVQDQTTITNTILDDAPCRVDSVPGGTLVDGGHNDESDTSCFGATSPTADGTLTGNAAIDLAASLAANGSSGPQTLAVPADSSAVGLVPLADCTTTTDERGVARPGTGATSCDAGAYEVQPAPITQTAPKAATVTTGHAYTGQLSATGGQGPFTWTQATGSPDLTVTSSGAITAPATLPAGSYTGTGTATDGVTVAPWTFTLTVSPTALTQSAPTAASVTTGHAYAGQLSATGATGPVTWTQAGGTPELTVTGSGAVTAPGNLAAGTYTARGTNTDNLGDAGTWTFTLTVAQAPWAGPAATGIPDPAAKQAQGFYLGASGEGWRLEVTQPHWPANIYAGTITIDAGALSKVSRVRLERTDSVSHTAKRIDFRFSDNSGIDGVSFLTPAAATTITFTLSIDGKKPTTAKVFLGKVPHGHPTSSPFTVRRA